MDSNQNHDDTVPKVGNGHAKSPGIPTTASGHDTQAGQVGHNGSPLSPTSPSNGAIPDNHLTLPEPPGRRPSLPERRNFRSPLSAPYDSQQSFSNFDGDRRPGTRKTSLPAPASRPTELELAAAAAIRRPARNRMRVSESAYAPLDFEERNRDTMPKSNSDTRMRASSGSGANTTQNQTSEHQLRDTEIVVQTFMTAAYQRDVEQIMVAVENDEESPVVAEVPSASASAMIGIVTTPDLPPELQTAPLSPAAEVGRRLAMLADEFDQRYRTELDDMALIVLPHILGNLTPIKDDTSGWTKTFEVFRNVARKLFENCQITWGRIVALLTFGYRLVMAVLRANLPGFVSKIVRLVSRFIVAEPIANWIYSQGGWLQALFFKPTAESPQQQAVVQVGFWSVQVLAGCLLVWDWLTRR